MAKPYTKSDDIPEMITERDSQRIIDRNSNIELQEWDICIHEVIYEQAIVQPIAEAVCSEGEGNISYAELDRLASGLAHHLLALELHPGSIVPLCFDKSIFNVVAMVAVLKAGMHFCPLDPTAPITRLRTLIQRLEADIVLCSQQHACLLAPLSEKVVPIEHRMLQHLPQQPENKLPMVSGYDLAYLIYTSGSTGEPKGTLIEHAAFCSSAKAHGPAMRMNAKSRVLQFAAHTFDASLVEILTTLMMGGTVCIPTEESRLNNIVSVINDMNVNWAVLTPSFVGFISPSDIPCLKTLVLAGEAISQANINTWASSGIKLVNGYGPSECSVASVVNSHVTPETMPSNIGQPVGVRLWIVDPDNHTRLVKGVGELIIQGPTLARGYYNDAEKTAASFVQPPTWAVSGDRIWRMYKTGDLVTQATDGCYHFIGRKDTQVKVHGQRVELGEIEAQLASDTSIKHGVVLLPKRGPLAGRLISIISYLTPAQANRHDVGHLQVVNCPTQDVSSRLSSLIPAYMVPSVFISVEDIPLLPSRKIDRKGLLCWAETFDNESYRRIIQISEPEANSTSAKGTIVPATETEAKLREIWSHVLNLSLEQTELHRSFLSLGGDSISALQVKGQCTKRYINVSVQDILRCKSITHLAQCAKALNNSVQHTEVLDQDFAMAPIQSLFFKLPNQGKGHFNQSFFLRLNQRVQKKDLRHAIEILVNRHSMLRARFSLSPDGIWQQRIINDTSSSYRLRAYDIHELDETTTVIANTQTALSMTEGPLFAADLFNHGDDEQLLFMVGHHLVIDLVSWRIILEDLEEILRRPLQISTIKPLSFQTWSEIQARHAQTLSVLKVLPGDALPPSDASYWGLLDRPNNYGGVRSEGFEIDAAITSWVLTECHGPLRTEPIDILLSALIYSFGAVFTDRNVPAIYNEGHGRETSGIPVDLSRTVGWFTTMYPVHVPSSASADMIETVRHVKDLRKRIPDKGRQYFASRCLTDEGDAHFGHHWPLEITFNYLGQYQQLERKGALLNPVSEMAGEARGAGGTADVGEDTPRFGLFEISAVVAQGRLRFSFTFNRDMLQQEQIIQWISKCRDVVGNMTGILMSLEPQLTLGDFPLLSLDYIQLKTLVEHKLPGIGVSHVTDVEDVYPCGSMQEGLLISQTKNAAFYAVQVILELKIHGNALGDRDQLAVAWKQVVDRHAALRTVFIESVSKDEGLYDQVVLKSIDPDIVQMSCSSEQYALRKLAEKRPMQNRTGPSHRFTICQIPNSTILCKLEISHTLMDGNSMSIIFNDLALAYEGQLSTESGPLYSAYVAHLQSQLGDTASLEYWKTYLKNIEPCNFPVLHDGIPVVKELRSLRLDFTNDKFAALRTYCDHNGVTFSNALHLAWGLTLRAYSDSESDVCFGYLTSGRDAPVQGIENAVGPFINTLVCRISMVPASRLGTVLDQIQSDYMDSLPHRFTSLAEIQHALQFSGTALFNTALSYQKLTSESASGTKSVSFEEKVPIYDPTEYPLSLNIVATDESAVIDLDFWTDHISEGQAQNIASTFTQALENVVNNSSHAIEELDFIGRASLKRILQWNSSIPESIQDCVHSVIQKQTRMQPDAPAICAWDAELSYSDMDDLSTRLAHRLVKLGIVPEMFVPSCFDKSAWAIVANIAVLKAGGAAVPLDAKHPRPALELRVREVEANIVLVAPDRAEMFLDMVDHVISVNREFLESLPVIIGTPCPTVEPKNPCFVIFTSGSTGKPKGVVLEHSAIVTSGHATGSAYNFGPHSRVLQFAAYTFDNSLAEIYITLMRGGCVCVPSEHDRLNNLAGVVNKLNVNFMDITPTVANFLHPSEVPNVKDVSLGGEPLTKENIEVWGKAVKLHCCYGPSEASINALWNSDLIRTLEATNIGKSIGSLSWVCDPDNHNRLTALGAIGELLIEGPILARGYLNDDEKTSKVFISNLAWATGSEQRRFYTTGDLVRQNSDGSLTYLGRKDSQVKLNGQRIELGEIEHHVKINLPPDAQSAVELVEVGSGKYLAAFLALSSDITTTSSGDTSSLLSMNETLSAAAATLESTITAALPVYMVPTMYIPANAMPMTSSGKLDRRQLRTLCEGLSEQQAASYRLAKKSGRAPSTAMEKSLATLWESVLSIAPGSVGAEDEFFRLGGDSIGAMKLITAARAQKITLNVANIFQKPKLCDIASVAALNSGTKVAEEIHTDVKPFSLLTNVDSVAVLKDKVAQQCQIATQAIQDMLPCTAIQEGLISLSNKNPGAYVAQNIYQLPADIDLEQFQAAWNKVVTTESILRTRVPYIEGIGFLQVVVDGPIRWQTATSVEEILDLDRQLPAYNGGSLSRYTIVKELNHPLFVWTAHHAIYDGWCISTVLEKVEACYRNPEGQLGASVPFSRFIEYLSAIDGSQSDDFWKAKLADTSTPQFPALPHPGYQVHATSLASHKAIVSRDVTSHVTLPSCIRAAWAFVVGIYSGDMQDVVFGEILTGRDAPVDGIADIIGPTLATIPTRILISPEITIAKFLEDVQYNSAGAIPYQYAGLQHIKQISEDTQRACMFQNLLAIHHDAKESTSGFWKLRSSGTSGPSFYSYPLTMSCQILDDRVDIDAHHDQDVIPTWQVERVLRQFEFILQTFVSPDKGSQKLCDANLLNPSDNALITSWNLAQVNETEVCIHQLFEKKVRELPESTIAIDSWDAKLTYRELDNLSTRLAQVLMGRGVESSLVPLVFEKSAWTIVAMLGVLKCNAAFVPLDPTAPIARLKDLVADTNATLVLCSSKYGELCRTIVPQHLIVDAKSNMNSYGVDGLATEHNDLPSCDSKSPAYVIFTSGTTGNPKGTIVQHAAFCAGAAAHAPALRMHHDSRVLQFASYTFDASLLETLTALTIGATICVPSDEERMNNIAKFIRETGVTWTLLTPSFIQTIQPSEVPPLRTLVLGGEALTRNQLTTWADKLELINAYGPTECSVIATVNPHVLITSDPANIGRAVGGRAWIADRYNHDRLMPIGSVGELLIEGPILARGYLNNKVKTDEVFTEYSKWARREEASSDVVRRMYKTGDLVKNDLHGNLIFCGRKDTQVKLRGQRLELGEVEHFLRTDPAIQHAQVTIPLSGFCKKRLVAVLSIRELSTVSSSADIFAVRPREACSFYLTGIRERLCDQLPPYMIPSNWVVVQQLPLLPSGKLDRRRIDKWVVDMSTEVYHQVSDVEQDLDISGATSLEKQLQSIWGNALNLPAEQIGMHQSFLHLGGDSISAMQVMSSCRSQDIGVTVKDIIQSKSIMQLAQCVTLPETLSYEEENIDVAFDLSPIQKLYFECVGDKWAHFNQSVLLRLSSHKHHQEIYHALSAVVQAHSMLRARFVLNEAAIWQQKIGVDASGAFRFNHRATTLLGVASIVEHSQKTLDIQHGPVFAVDLLKIEGGDQQILSLVAHHLVIDVVSWRIVLRDLEELLTSQNLATQPSLPFQTWSRLQLEHTQQAISQRRFHPDNVPAADLAYWDMVGKPNIYGDTMEDSFEIDIETSLLLLGTCHESLKTDPVDIFLTSVILSFRKVFSDRATAPTIFNEGHGREPWPTSKIDLSRTVGWFTTMCPIYLPSDAEGDNDLINTIRWVKDLRNRIPEKGRNYFAYRLLTNEGSERFPGHWPMEVIFNYLGKLQQLERSEALLQQFDSAVNTKFDIADDVPRFALFEISAQVVHGAIKFSFSYNRKMKRQAKIRRWVVECQHSLREIAQRLVHIRPERTLADFPLLPLSYHGIANLTKKLPSLGLNSLEEIEDCFPCSPMQQGILLAQVKDQNIYAYVAVFEITSTGQRPVDAKILAEAWQDVVKRHSALRTIFIESNADEAMMDQVVVKSHLARIAWLQSRDSNAERVLAQQENINFRDARPPHRLSLCQTNSGILFMKMEISHVICDGTSIPILLRDLSRAYDTRCRTPQSGDSVQVDSIARQHVETRAPLYSEYIAHLQSKSLTDNINYWKSYLMEIEPCSFPSLTDGQTPLKELRSLVLTITQPSELRSFCSKNGVTLSNVLQLVWAMILKIYTGSTDVSFGYLTSGRDAPIQGIQDSAVGAFINMLTCRIDLKDTMLLTEALDRIQSDFVKSMAHQACSLADIQHELGLSGASLFNTAFTFQKRTGLSQDMESTIDFKLLETQDPSEYDVTVNVEALDTTIEIHFGYWTTVLSEAQAISMSKTFDHVLNSIIGTKQARESIGDLDLLSDHGRARIMKWNSTIPAKVDRCIHSIIDEQKLDRSLSTPAIAAWDGNLTYTDLEHVTNKLAAHLVRTLNIAPGMFVPLLFEKSMYTVISMVAVLKAGGAFVPLDPTHPQGRLKHFVDDVGAKVVLCSSMHVANLREVVELTLVVDKNLLQALDNYHLASNVVPSDPAYIIFTSGTTGTPKGTIIQHSAFATSAIEHTRAMCMGSDSRVLQFASHTFDASVMEMLSCLIVGGCVCIPSDMDRMNDIPGVIRKFEVTWTLLTPSVANTLSPKSVPSLKTLVTGGEAMSSGHIAKWKGKNICLINAYGPSEASVIASTSTKVDERGVEVDSDTSSIGHAVGGRNWVVDPRDYNKLTMGIGELVVEGHHVAKGYLNNEQKTAQAFVSGTKWMKEVGAKEKMYRTGDLVRWNSDGTLSFVARKDTQIKLNGQRIELGEIEHHVRENLPEDSQSAVELVTPMSRVSTKALSVFFCLPEAAFGPRVKGTMTGDEILLPTTNIARRIAKKLDSSLAEVLPTYMIPSFYVPVSKMPWTVSGKLDRIRLRNIIATLPQDSSPPYRLTDADIEQAASPSPVRDNEVNSLPTSDNEVKLQRLWAAVMNTEQGSIGTEDSFFKLGGDSVTAMKLVGAARQESISLSVIDIFRNPRLCDMASVCGILDNDAHTELKPFGMLNTDNVDTLINEFVEHSKLQKSSIQDAYPCSTLQEGLLTLSIRQTGAYVAHNTFHVPVEIDIERFKSVWQQTVDEVDILRTRIVHLESGKFMQVVATPQPIDWHYTMKLQDFKTGDIMLPAHNGGELTRYTIVEEDGGKRYFIWSIHHSLYDGWALPMILSRVQSAYLDSASSFPKSSYASFIKYVTDIDIHTSDNFWRARLEGASPLQFPTVSRTEDNRSRQNHVLTHSICISKDSAKMEVTLPTIIRAAWALIVANYSGSNDVVFGETLAGRDIPVTGITDIIGPIFTTVPTRIQVDRASSVSQFLQGIHQSATEIIPFQHAGLQRIKHLDSSTALACEFQNLLVIQTAEEDTEDEFWQMAKSGVADNFFTYPLVLECKASVDSTKVDINAHFDTNVTSPWEVQRILYQLDHVLNQLSTTQNSRVLTKVADIQIFSPQDQELIRASNFKAPMVLNSTIPEEFEKIALSQPDAPALDSWDGKYTYGEVQEHALRLAHHLMRLDVGPECFVTICMDKSAQATICMLAIMMSGGAYSPLDPSAPVSRHKEMLDDLNSSVLVCDPKYSDKYRSLVNHVISVDDAFIASLESAPISGHALSRATSNNAAYVMFTSGSAGKPKGVVVSHRAISTSSVAMREALLMNTDARVFQFASYTFDVSVLEMFTTLTYGGCVCIPSEESRVSRVEEVMASLRVHWSFLTPSVANLIDPAAVPELAVLVCGGEAMSSENVIKWTPHVTLVNGYGPTESSVIGVSNSKVSQERDPTNIGRALAGNQAWITDSSDHNRLAPIGSAGELVLSGAILAREYINMPEKTAEAFIDKPLWISSFGDNSSISRVYKTGDLVQYNEDMSIRFIGRKDNQVKLHGQRMELGEIENALDIDPQIKHALVALPKAGHFKKRLVAVLSLAEIAPVASSSEWCQIVHDGPRGIAARSEVVKAKRRLSERLLPFMIPSTWIVVESVPLLPSGKLDRRGVTLWLEHIDEPMYEMIMEADVEEDDTTPPTDTSLLLQQIFMRVLNLPVQKVKLSASFLNVGGDSITAMQVMALCRKEKINFSLSEVLRSKSIHQLAASARYESDRVFQAEEIEKNFELSPIQQLYFQQKTADEQRPDSRFNQSFSLRITRRVDPETVRTAISAVVEQHTMLRARFTKGSFGWQQRISANSSRAFQFQAHHVQRSEDVPAIIGSTQSGIDAQNGPVFAVDLINIADQEQMIFLAAAHLVIDMVSWRIVLGDLEEHLNGGSISSDRPLSFQVWCAMQEEQSRKLTAHQRQGTLPFNVKASEVTYWGMEGQENTYSDVISETFTIGENITALALGESNLSLRSEPVELFLAAIAHSFSRIFVDRETPALWNENHGRETWDSSIDISRTVGWFTTIFPLQVDVDANVDDVIDTVRRVKDGKRKVPNNGRPYFASRFLTPEGRLQFKNHAGTMEIIFNYLGRMQQLENDNSLLQQWTAPENDINERQIADVGPQAERFALFEISASVVRDQVHFSFLYNKKMSHQQQIKRWILECQRTLEETVRSLSGMKDEVNFTLSDFPLLPISYDGLDKILNKSLPQVGITPSMVQDIYPAAPLQEGLILSQIKDPSIYHFHAVFEVHIAADGLPIDSNKLMRAWQEVVNYHGALRTVFADSVYKGDIFNQIVVKQVPSGALAIECEESEALKRLRKISILDHNYKTQPRLPHQITICKCTSGKVYFKAEINHGVIDGGSANIMLRDLAAAYHDQLPIGPGPSYGEYIKYIKTVQHGTGNQFWKKYLEGVRACHFPILNKTPTEKLLHSASMSFGRFPELQEMCKKMKVTLANVMQAAWALCLRSYTKSEDVCFGNLTSGRDVPVKHVQDTVGAFINMLVCRVKFSPQLTLKEVYQKVQSEYIESLEFQHTSLAQVQHDIAGGAPLFNTAISIQKGASSDEAEEKGTICFDPVAAHDPGEYAITLNVRTFLGDEGMVLRYWTNFISDEQAAVLASTVSRVLEHFVNKPHQTVEELDLSEQSVKPKLAPPEPPRQTEQPTHPLLPTLNSSDQLRALITDCVREVIDQMFKNGTLVSYGKKDIQDTVNLVNSQMARPIKPIHVNQAMIDYSQLTSGLPGADIMEPTRTTLPDPLLPAECLDDEVERKLLFMWSELLQISPESIKGSDSFFALGGDSIIAMQLVGVARDEDLALTVASIFRHPTFADMATVIRLADEANAPLDVTGRSEYAEAREVRAQTIQSALYQRYSLLEAPNVDSFLQDNICPRVTTFRGGIIDVFPVTDFQALAVAGTLMESKWMLNYFHLEADGPLDLKRLKISVYRVVDAIEILRTVFVPYGNRFFQVVLRKLVPSFSVQETDNLAQFTSALQLADRENGPRLGESYLAFTVAKEKGSHRHRIIIRMSHAQYDGVCMPAILGAIQTAYRGEPVPATPSFSTYVRDTARNTTDSHYVYWKKLLEGSSMTEVVRRNGPNYSRGGDVTSLKRIVHFASLAAHAITPATIIKAAWTVVLAQLAGEADIVFGNVISGRNAAVLGVESIIGPCVNMVPVRVRFDNGWTILDLLHHIQNQQVTNMPYESLGFREIIKHCTDWADWCNFSTVCQHQNIQRSTQLLLGKNEYTLGAIGSQEDFADITILSIPQIDDNVELSLIYTTSSGVPPELASKLFESLCTTSTAFAESPASRLPSPAELLQSEKQILVDPKPGLDTALSANLRGITRDELLLYNDVLTLAWRQILWDNKGSTAVIDLNSSFYELGGDIIGIAQLASVLEQEGFRLRVEDLVDHPVLIEQLALCAMYRKDVQEREAAEADELREPEVEETVVEKKGLRKMLGKAGGLKKMLKGRKKDDGGGGERT